MTRLLYLLIVAQVGRASVKDFKRYRFETDASYEGDPRHKPARNDAPDAGEAETGPHASEDAAPAPAPDAAAQMPAPTPDASEGPADAGSVAPDAAGGTDAATTPDAALRGLEGSWDVELPLLTSTCNGTAPLDADTWTVTTDQLTCTAGTFGGSSTSGSFTGTVPGGGLSVHWQLDLSLQAGELHGQVTQTLVSQSGAMLCQVTRGVQGTRWP